jgi:hypothetical protein
VGEKMNPTPSGGDSQTIHARKASSLQSKTTNITMNDLFLAASRRQLRFTTSRGHIATEDLWSLSLQSLNSIGQFVIANLKPGAESLLENPDARATQAEEDEKLRLEIIKAVIKIKQDENKAKLAESTKASQRQFIKELLEKKKIGAMESMSEEELQAQLAALG